MKLSKKTKSNDPAKILKMISRNEELERNDGKWISKDRPWKNKKKYNRRRDKKVDLDSSFFLLPFKTLLLKFNKFIKLLNIIIN